MEKSEFDNIKENWQEIARYNHDKDFSFELEVHKKLLSIFHVGAYYYYIFNCATATIEYVNEKVKQVMEMESTDQLSTEYLVNNMHPDDLPYFFEFESRVVTFLKTLGPKRIMKYKMSYDYRVRTPLGRYIRVLQQSVTIQSDGQGAVIRSLGVHTDITNLKQEGIPTLSYIGLEGEPSYYDVASSGIALEAQKMLLTKREKEVLKLLAKGKTSKQIAGELFISKLTVDGHRKSMLKKMNCRSTMELTVKMML